MMLFASLIMMLLPMVASDVMFANCAKGTTSLPQATSSGKADIICPKGQTSFKIPHIRIPKNMMYLLAQK